MHLYCHPSKYTYLPCRYNAHLSAFLALLLIHNQKMVANWVAQLTSIKLASTLWLLECCRCRIHQFLANAYHFKRLSVPIEDGKSKLKASELPDHFYRFSFSGRKGGRCAFWQVKIYILTSVGDPWLQRLCCSSPESIFLECESQYRSQKGNF